MIVVWDTLRRMARVNREEGRKSRVVFALDGWNDSGMVSLYGYTRQLNSFRLLLLIKRPRYFCYVSLAWSRTHDTTVRLMHYHRSAPSSQRKKISVATRTRRARARRFLLFLHLRPTTRPAHSNAVILVGQLGVSIIVCTRKHKKILTLSDWSKHRKGSVLQKLFFLNWRYLEFTQKKTLK